MESNLEELKALVFSDGWEDDAKEQVRKLETSLQEAAAAEGLAQSPAIKPYLDYLNERIDKSKAILHTKRTTAIEQEYLFAIIELAERFTTLFTGQARESTEKAIKHFLDVARSR